MKKLNHPNLVQLYEVLDDRDEDSLYMVLEICKNGVVMKVGLGETAEPYPEEQCRHWFRDLILGIEYRTRLVTPPLFVASPDFRCRKRGPNLSLTASHQQYMRKALSTETSSRITCFSRTTASSKSSTSACPRCSAEGTIR